jgi:hypothetical protein
MKDLRAHKSARNEHVDVTKAYKVPVQTQADSAPAASEPPEENESVPQEKSPVVKTRKSEGKESL